MNTNFDHGYPRNGYHCCLNYIKISQIIKTVNKLYYSNIIDLSESLRETRPPRRRTHSTGHSKKEAENIRSVS